jgi:glutaredoxin 3
MNTSKLSKIKLFSTTTCPFCIMEAMWLNNKKIKYEKVNVDLDQKEAEDMVRKTRQMGVPVTSLLYEDGSEEFIVGFDRPKLEQALKIQK